MVIGQIKKIADSWRPDTNDAGIEACQDPLRAAVCPVKVAGKLKHTVKLSTTKQSGGSIGSCMAKLSKKQRANAKTSRKSGNQRRVESSSSRALN